MKNFKKQNGNQTLRNKAEILLKNAKDKNTYSEIDSLKLIHELEVHQIELEMQNEELIHARSEALTSAEKYTELYDFAPTGYFTFSENGEIVELNLTGASMLNNSRSYLKNKFFGIYITIYSRPNFNTFLANVFATRVKQTCEIEIIQENQTVKYFHIEGIVLDNESNCLANIMDITKNKESEKKLFESREKLSQSEADLKKAQAIALIGNWSYNVQTNELIWSDELYAIFEINKNEYTGAIKDSFDKLIFPEDKDKVELAIKSAINEEVIIPIEYRILLDNGDLRYVWSEIADIKKDDFGNPFLLVGIIQDVSQRKLTEIDLIHERERAEENNRLKSAFLANMSHEIRTPMNGILGFAEILKDQTLNLQEQQEYLDIIEKSGIRMLNIINDIVDISKIESGQMEVSLSETNINDVLKYIFNLFKLEVEKKGIQLSYDYSLVDENAMILTDREKLYAILSNLVKNAVKFTTVGKIDFGYEYKNESLRFFVKDSGLGIEKSKQKIIFERFIQADVSDKRSYQGAGLGLSISKAYVEMLGGKIGVESEFGKGSMFYFTIPYKKYQQTPEINTLIEPYSKITTNNLKKLKILIAEDDEITTKLINTIVAKYSIHIFKVRNGNDAVETCKNNPDIDLIFMDIQMPDMNGYEAIKQIREFNTEVIIFAESAFVMLGDKEKAFSIGSNEYLSKPYKSQQLIELLYKYFSTDN
jgi:signal transduction histidine kinase/CheY-like chemotaxis protein